MKMKYKKQHLYFCVRETFNSAKEFLLAVLVLISAIFSKGNNYKVVSLAIALIVVVVIVITIISWKNNVYSFDEKGMHIKEGVIKRKSRYIPCDKIHTMDMDSKFLQRLFKVTTLRIDTASGGKEAEVSLVLSKIEAENIRNVLFNKCRKKNEEEVKVQEFSNENRKYKASVGDLVITAITSQYIMGVMFLILTLYGKANDMLSKNMKTKLQDFENRSIEGIMLYKEVKVIAALVIVAILVTFIISIISTVIKYYDFTVCREKNNINITYGLFNKKSVIIPIYRIQSISMVQGLLKKPFDAVTINIESIGYGKEQGESTMLCPLIKRNKIDEFFKEILTEITPEFQFFPSSKKSLGGYLMRNGLIPLIIGVFITCLFHYGFLIFIPVFFCFLLGYYKYKSAGICIKEKELVVQFRVLAKHVVIIPKQNIQSITKSQSIFQKRNNLINIKAAVQGEIVEEQYTVKGMDYSEFIKLQNWFINEDIKTKA